MKGISVYSNDDEYANLSLSLSPLQQQEQSPGVHRNGVTWGKAARGANALTNGQK